jgi:enoyl-CoA hydratase/carnithine racemase
MILAEQELTIQVRHFNVVVVSAVHLTFGTAAKTHKGESLHVFTAKRTSADHKGLDVSKFLLNFTAENLDLIVISAVHWLAIALLLEIDSLCDVVVKPLLKRGVLASKFDDLLSDDTTEESSLGNN